MNLLRIFKRRRPKTEVSEQSKRYDSDTAYPSSQPINETRLNAHAYHHQMQQQEQLRQINLQQEECKMNLLRFFKRKRPNTKDAEPISTQHRDAAYQVSDYQVGYNTGYQAGLAAAQNSYGNSYQQQHTLHQRQTYQQPHYPMQQPWIHPPYQTPKNPHSPMPQPFD